MGFFDDLKEGIRRGTEAAQRAREEEAAKEATKKAGKKGAAPQPAATGTGRKPGSTLPEGVYMVNLKKVMEPIVYGTDENGADLILQVSGSIMFRQDEPDSTDVSELRRQVASIAREKIRAALPSMDMSDQKNRMVVANGLNQMIRDALKAKGFTAVFKLPLIIDPAE